MNKLPEGKFSIAGDSDSRPLWSVMIPTFNCATELQKALTSVLEQDLGAEQMQICVVDDCSTQDDPALVVNRVGRGRVSFLRRATNGGNGRAFNSCLELARGRLVHILHGDDWVLPGFYSTMTLLLERHPEAGMAFCRHYYSDNQTLQSASLSPLERSTDGIVDGWLARLAIQQRIQYAATVVRKEVYDLVGQFQNDMPNCEDWEMWMRIAHRCPVAFTPMPLAVYRLHSNNLSSRVRRSGLDIACARKAIQLFTPLIPENDRRTLLRRAYYNQANWALTLARGFAGRGDLSSSHAQFHEALKTSIHCSLWGQFVLTGLRIVAHHIRTTFSTRRSHCE